MKFKILFMVIIFYSLFGCFGPRIDRVSNPSFISKDGTYQEKVLLKINCDTDDAVVLYTLDGSEPLYTNALTYKIPVEITTSVTVKAKAVKKGMSDSNTVVANYIIKNDFVKINGGTFIMGDKFGILTYPEHTVKLSYNFYISKYETTQKDYYEITKETPSKFIGDNLPVEQISWWEAIKYCNSRSKMEGFPVAYDEKSGEFLDVLGKATIDITQVKGYRLPTEAEWEYCAKGGEKTKGYKYSGSDNIDEVAWYFNNSTKITHMISSKKPNELGLYDMSGNVWEWCSDYKDIYSSESVINPYVSNAGLVNKIVRGGSCNYGAEYAQNTYREENTPEGKFYYIGMRMARTE